MKATLKSVNAAVTKAGIPLELVRGDGYHYWVLDTPSRFDTLSEYVCYTNCVTVERWLEWAHAAYATMTKYEVTP